MSKKQFLALALIMAVTSLLGGAFASWLLRPTVVTAQQDPDTISAKQFVVVDDAGNAKAMLTEDSGGAGLYIYDADGNVRALISHTDDNGPAMVLSYEGSEPGAVIMPGGAGIMDAKGNYIWNQP